MAGVSVTLESLHTVKRAFSDFQTDVESLSDKIGSSTEQVLVQVRQSVKKQESTVAALESRVASLTGEIERIQSSIIALNTQIHSLRSEIAELEKQKPQLEERISQLERKKQQLEAQRNNSQGDSGGVDEQIRAIENELRRCRSMLTDLNERLSAARQKLAECERRCAELRQLKAEKESELMTAKSELSRAKSKLERLSSAGDAVEREIANLNMAVRKFEQTSSATAAASKSGVNRCIAEIEEYLSVNLGPSGSGGGSGGGSGAPSPAEGTQAARSFPFSSSNEMPDNVYDLVRGYQENPEWNRIIRSGGSTAEIESFRGLISRNSLSEDAHFVRRASLADLGPELQNLSLEDLSGRSYSFVGIMSASGSQSMANESSSGNVIFDITAPAGTAALDLTNLPDYQEVMFDSPRCHIDSAEMCGYNTIRVNITLE